MLKSSIRKNDVIEKLQALIGAGGESSRLLSSLCRCFYGDLAGAALENEDPAELTGSIRSLFGFIEWRQPGEARVRAFNPAVDTDGWASRHSVFEMVMEDRPHLVASLGMALQHAGLTVHQIVHPVLRIERDDRGRLLQLASDRPGGVGEREAVLRFEVDRQDDPAQLQTLAGELQQVIEDVRIVDTDGGAMRQRLEDAIGSTATALLAAGMDDEHSEASLDYLRWLRDGRFTFIGYAHYRMNCASPQQCRLSLDDPSRLGILALERHFPADKKEIELSPYLSTLMQDANPLVLTKSTYRSPVARAGHLDYLGVKAFDEAGRVVGEHRFFGLYSACAGNHAVTEVPLLRLRIERLRSRLGVPADSFRGQLLERILAHYPREELLQSDEHELEEILGGMLEAHDRPALRLFTRTDVYGRFVNAMVLVPREKFNAPLRRRLQAILLQGLAGSDAEYRVCEYDGLLVTVQYRIHTRDAHCLGFDGEALERQLADALLSWEDRLQAALVSDLGEARGLALSRRFIASLPAGYRSDVAPGAAVRDLLRLEGLGARPGLDAWLYHGGRGPGFRLYGRGAPLALSSVLPILENLGARVIAARPYELTPPGTGWMLDFDIEVSAPDARLQGRFEETFLRVCDGTVENDGYNGLVVTAGLNWRQALLFRTLGRYLAQIRLPFSQQYLQEALARNAAITAMLGELFAARFDPTGASEAAVAVLLGQLEQGLEAVGSLDDERILRAVLAVIQALLRTNFYQTTDGGAHKAWLSFKLRPAAIPGMPQPCPLYEIFVYSPRVEGVHLRGGKVARGGLRWSDRREDYRTEVLGLLKAQMVKNAVIVPAGSKGGFYCKRLPEEGGREAQLQEATECYRLFIRGLLDLTDNRVDGKIVPPPSLVRHDEDDPYLVVAADKGTATFSDIANAIAREYGYWLGDAFASGGANGYDHKKMGITARGAWESVRRLFREQGRDLQREPFTVVGIGDMSGDVFGNGMLLSPGIRLVAAFNHRHIFVDPNPDAVTSFAERQRLFALPRSGWDDYDPALISVGGGVFSRAAKQLPISPEMRTALGIDSAVKTLPPNELIRLILRAPVELLWNGGIGTYVKASDESHDSVGDRANDAVRIDAAELRCAVVGEGGNLGLTQRGRIEFARRGGLVNTDAIDNSGGVDCSDHEVNIKVLMHQAVEQGTLSLDGRNRLLAQMQGQVAALVLQNNYRQAERLSLAAADAGIDLQRHRELIQLLEQQARLDPALEALPAADELAQRAERGEGLARPEIAVLCAYSKIWLTERLCAAGLADQPWFAKQLNQYFPALLGQRLPALVQAHPLRQEILATLFAGELVNRMGPAFAPILLEECHCSELELLGAFVIARELLGAESLWQRIDDLGITVAYGAQLDLLRSVQSAMEQACRWLLLGTVVPGAVESTLKRLQPGVALAEKRLDCSGQNRPASLVEARVSLAVPQELAEAVARLPLRLAGLDIVRIAERSGAPLEAACDAYRHIGEALDVDWLRRSIQALPEGDCWQRRARAALAAQLGELLCDLGTGLLLGEAESRDGVQAGDGALAAVRALFERMGTGSSPDFTRLSVALQELRRLTQPVAERY